MVAPWSLVTVVTGMCVWYLPSAWSATDKSAARPGNPDTGEYTRAVFESRVETVAQAKEVCGADPDGCSGFWHEGPPSIGEEACEIYFAGTQDVYQLPNLTSYPRSDGFQAFYTDPIFNKTEAEKACNALLGCWGFYRRQRKEGMGPDVEEVYYLAKREVRLPSWSFFFKRTFDFAPWDYEMFPGRLSLELAKHLCDKKTETWEGCTGIWWLSDGTPPSQPEGWIYFAHDKPEHEPVEKYPAVPAYILNQ